jgi:hypothetical protein
VGHQDYFLAPLPGSIALFVSSLGIHIVCCNPFIMGKPRDGKFHILPSTTRRGMTLNTSVALDSPSVMSKLLTPPQAHATTSAEFEDVMACRYNPLGTPRGRYDKHSSKSSLSCETKVESNQ